MPDTVSGAAVSVYLLLSLLFVALAIFSIKIIDRRINGIKGRYTLGQVPPLSSYGYASYVQWVALLWAASVALLIAAAALDQWATWQHGYLTLKFGIFGATEGAADTLTGSDESVPYSKLLEALSDIPALQPQVNELGILFHYLQVAGIMTLMWTVVALSVSCIGLAVLAVYQSSQRPSNSSSVIQWWWSRKCYNWLAVSRCLNKLVTLTWFSLGGIPLIIDAAAQQPQIQFGFGLSWYLSLISSLCIAAASSIASSQIQWDRIVRSATSSSTQSEAHAHYVATQQQKYVSPTPHPYRYNSNTSVPAYQSRVSSHPLQSSAPPPPPPTAVSEREARIAGGWWPRWTYWR